MWKILAAKIRKKIYYSLTSRRLFPDEQIGWRKGSRGTAEFLYIDQLIINESKTRRKKSSYGLDWLQKGIWYGSIKLDNILSQNVQNITWSHKLHRNDHEDLERGADSRRKKISWKKIPKRNFPRRCTIKFTLHNSHDTTEPHTQENTQPDTHLADRKRWSINRC